MPIPVTISTTPLVFDSLPALKTRYYYGDWPYGGIYTLGRMYILGGDLHVSLSAFEKDPAPESCVCLGLCAEGPAAVFAKTSPAALMVSVREGDNILSTHNVPPRFFRSADEQGWSWGAEFVLDAQLLQRAGIVFANNPTFRAALYKYTAGCPAYGVSNRLLDEKNPFSIVNFETCEAVTY